jgi:hypothetical protein
MKTYQHLVMNWMMACFSNEIVRNAQERNHRFLEESLELVQSLDCTREAAHRLVDYVFDRPHGQPVQELGGVMVTLAALSSVHGLDMRQAGDAELARAWQNIDKIRAKQLVKPQLYAGDPTRRIPE